MANEVLKSIASDITVINQTLQEAKELVSAAKEAGEDVAEMESDIKSLEIRKTKWELMLKARGAM